MARVSGVTRRIPMQDDEGDVVGWVMFDGFTEYVAIDADVFVPSEFLLRLPGDAAQPALSVAFIVRDGAPIPTAVNFEAKPGGRHVVRGDLDGLAKSFNNWIEAAVKAVMQHGDVRDDSLTLGGRSVTKPEARQAAAQGRKQANQKVNPAFLREVAALYRDNEGTGRIIEAIIERFGCSVPTANRWIGKAREAGFIPPLPKKGKK